jgi:cell division protein YceG involved in septum cleavage
MSLSSKITTFSLVVIMLFPLGILWYVRAHRPPPPPPPEPRKEINLTIIPGWNLRDVADDWVKKGIVKTPEELFAYTGTPATDYRTHASAEPVRRIVTSTDFDILFSSKPNTISYEGYLFPETYRVYADAKPDEVLQKIFGAKASDLHP